MLKKIFLTDREILRRIQQNDRTVLGELFLTNEKMIRGYIINHGGDNNDIQDLLQEAIITLWQNVNSDRFELNAKISTFLFAVVKNKWMAEIRRRKKLDYNNLSVIQKGNDNDTLGNIIDDEQRNLVKQALDKLEYPCKELLLLFYFEERKMIEIAQILGFANSDVAKAKKYQCKKTLERILKQQLKKK